MGKIASKEEMIKGEGQKFMLSLRLQFVKFLLTL